jgi:hypothetical protein
MHIAYSALRTKPKNGRALPVSKDLTERLNAYENACDKYRAEIAAIQKYMPGWMPPFEAKG